MGHIYALGALVFFMGAVFFSFLNVVAYRLPKKLDFVRGRSFCPECGHLLNYVDLLPILGYIIRGGKCCYCKARISPRYLLSEVMGGAAALLCVWRFWGDALGMLLAFAFIACLYPVAAIDADTMEIPDGFHIAIFALAVAAIFVFPEVSLVSRLIGAVEISLPMFLLTLAIEGAFGGGDMKLMAAAGAFLGWKATLVSAAIALLTGGAYGIWLLATKKADRKAHFAFGPFLCFGLAVGLLFAEELTSWYLGLFF